jgi:hypothetical protein
LEVDDRGINETRANACEIVAWRFLSKISERDAVDYCFYELPETGENAAGGVEGTSENGATETSSLLPQFRARDSSALNRPTSKRVDLLRSVSHVGGMFADTFHGQDDEE